MDRFEKIVAFEEGDMSDEELIGFFQELIDDGSAWTLQGMYGRMAMRLIEAGYCHKCEPKERMNPYPGRRFRRFNLQIP